MVVSKMSGEDIQMKKPLPLICIYGQKVQRFRLFNARVFGHRRDPAHSDELGCQVKLL